MRARYPDQEGFAERDGVRLFYEVYGDGEPTLLFMSPSWATHSRMWKAQIPYFARHFRVVAYDARGSGRSDRPKATDAFTAKEFVNDAIAVLDATGTDCAIPVGASASTPHVLGLCAIHPDRVLGACVMGPFFPLRGDPPGYMTTAFNERRDSYAGFDMYNRHCFREDWRGFAETWFELCYPEPHSTRQIENGVNYALEVDPETAIKTLDASRIEATGTVAAMMEGEPAAGLDGLARNVSCPALVITGDLDAITPVAWSEALVEAIPDARLKILPRAGHIPCGRYPVWFNLVLREFVESLAAPITAAQTRSEPSAA